MDIDDAHLYMLEHALNAKKRGESLTQKDYAKLCPDMLPNELNNRLSALATGGLLTYRRDKDNIWTYHIPNSKE